ncbi:MAG: sn-glycerol-1-phosphate dehydrogenase [Clostridia bacterium]|nr:sn-glycerol-1-phosphate dehydrogenase [Clostridia bacterium]
MNINEILLGVDCRCGKRHTCAIEKVYIEKGACARLGELCLGYNSILIVADENTYSAGGERVRAALSDKKLSEVIFDGRTVLIPDERAIERVRENIEGIDMIIALGSGVIQDLCKYVSHFNKIPYIDVATAPSMDGYASDGAAMILAGMKETVKAGLPKAIVCDVDILKDAPLDMIKAGYGDIIGKYSALCDWRLANIVNGEYLCEYIYSTTMEMVEKTLSLAKGLMERDEESVAALAEALVVVGIMMSFAGSSRPASGSEHHLSHFFEIVGIVKGEDYFPHGIDVAYSAVVTASIREELMETPFPRRKFLLPRGEYEEKMKNIYGSVAEGCIALQDKIGNYTTDRTEKYLRFERTLKQLFKETPTSWEIEGMLRLVGLDLKEFHDKYGTEKINDAISYAKDLKDRYTVLWMYYDLFGEQI